MLVRVLLALLLPLPAGAVTVSAARSVIAHLDNAAALKAVPLAPPAALIDTSIPTSLGVAAGKELPLAYLRSAADERDPAGTLVAAVATKAAAAEPAARLLHRAGAEGAEAARRLRKFAEERWGWTLDYALKDDRLSRRLAQLFDQSAPLAAATPAAPVPGRRLKPSRELVDRWFDQPSDSVGWVFQGLPEREVEFVLNASGAKDELHSLAYALAKPGPPPPAAERRVIEKHLAGARRFYEARRVHVEAPLGETFRTLGELVGTMLSRGVAGPALRAIMNHALAYANGSWSVHHGPGTWRALTSAQRDAAYERLDLLDDSGVTLDPAALGIEHLLTRFMRERLGTFAECTGPNCYNAALSSRDDFESPGVHTSGRELMLALSDERRWTRVHGEERRAGDVLFYKDAAGQPTHAAVYLKDGLVFTKNGMQRVHPYVVQTMEHGEKTYFPGTGWILEVYRPVR